MKHAVPESPLPPHYADGIYHEEQRLFKCGKHALNNLLGAEVFHTDQLDGIARLNRARSGLGPSLFGTLVPGYWDANVIQRALFEQGYDCDYFDRRRPVGELELGPERGQDGGTPAGDAPIGLVLNVVTSRFMGIMRHWRAIRRLAPDLYANVDSRLARPQVLTTEELRTHLDTMSRNGNDCTVLVVKKIPELSRA